ncbi:MAG: hypothetical protein WCE63_11045 [Acidobacteriaceae bacterium]
MDGEVGDHPVSWEREHGQLLAGVWSMAGRAAHGPLSIGRPLGHDDNSGVGDVVTNAIMFQIVTTSLAVPDCDVLVENGTANLALPSDNAIVEND